MDCSPPDSLVHGILQARILEWVATSFSRGSSQPRDRTQVSCIAGRHFNLWATREAWYNNRRVSSSSRRNNAKCACNRASKTMKQKQIKLKSEIYKLTVTVWEVNSPVLVMGRTKRQKMRIDITITGSFVCAWSNILRVCYVFSHLVNIVAYELGNVTNLKDVIAKASIG